MVTIGIFINELSFLIRMEPLSAYLTKEGWKEDFKKTRYRKIYELGLVTSSMPIFAKLGAITIGLAGAHIGELVDNSEVGAMLGFTSGGIAGLISPWMIYFRNGLKNRQYELMQRPYSVADSDKK